jgi:hypothetical protein
MAQLKKISFLMWAALVILGLTAIYWLIQGVGLMLSAASLGTYSFYLILALIMIASLFVSRARPLLGGIILVSLSILLAIYFLMVKITIYNAGPFLFLMCLPLAISGLLFIEADWSKRKKES